MAAQCPRCGTNLKDDYGMTQCPGCSVFAFVDMDGNAQINSPDAPEEAASESIIDATVESYADTPTDFAANFSTDSMMPAMDPAGIETTAVNADLPSSYAEEISGISGISGVPENQISDFQMENPADSFESMEAPEAEQPLDFQMGIVDEAAPEPPSDGFSEALPDFGPADDPLGLNGFANSEISSGKDGPFLFRILILGIDSKEIRESIREALEDSRFGWDPDQILSKLDKGKLVIEDLAPVKATIIIHRIRRLPVKIRWEQYAISQIEP
ncbi:MAG: hypothetical protein V4692_01570 [Bdellovibrionota bacterium]